MKKILIYLKFKAYAVLGPFFNKVIRTQYRNPKSIPIIIISFNQLFYLKQLIDFLKDQKCNNIVIVDNNSNYPPLLEYLWEIEKEVTVIRMKKNYGHNVFTHRQDLFEDYLEGYYVITDPDIVPDSNCPHDFMRYFKKLLDSNPSVRKVGFSLRTDNIPNTNPEKSFIQKRQQVYGELARRDRKKNFYADIDTTFAMYRPKIFDFLPVPYLSGIRTKPPYSASHGGWHIDPQNLTEEQLNYLNTSNDSGSWKIDANGLLVNKKFE